MTCDSTAAGQGAAKSGQVDNLPIALKLDGRKCLVVGSSPETAERGRALLASGAHVQILATQPDDALLTLSRGEGVLLEQRAWRPDDLDDCWLVVFTDRSAEEAESIGRLCNERRILYCAIDQPEHGSFNHVAVAKAGRLWAAIGTNGTAPALAGRLRQLLQQLFDRSNLAEIAERFAILRAATPVERRRETLVLAAQQVQLSGKLTYEERASLDAPERQP
jgi:uroporphyrin-III C-methyltransferase / precorrin-2 dehydrogenase / sirohydrochlorin ferrochelatase